MILLIGLCKKETDLPKIDAKKTDIIGTWEVDVDAMKENMGCNPLHRLGLEMYKNMTIKITKNTLIATLTIMGKTKSFSGKYRVVSVNKNVVVVKAISGEEKGKKSSIEFLTRDRIKFDKKGDDSPPMIMIRK